MDELRRAISEYKPPNEAKQLVSSVKFLMLVGPAGVGKDTLESELINTGRFEQVITHTTRPLRYNHGVLELNGVGHHFISNSEAIAMMSNSEFIEVAFTHGYLYGTSIEAFRLATTNSKIPVSDIDVKGVRSYLSLSARAIAVFLLPPSFKALTARLIKRYGQELDQRDINIRLTTAVEEFNELLGKDYFHIIIQSNITKSVNQVLSIVDGKDKPDGYREERKLASQLVADIKKYLKQH